MASQLERRRNERAFIGGYFRATVITRFIAVLAARCRSRRYNAIYRPPLSVPVARPPARHLGCAPASRNRCVIVLSLQLLKHYCRCLAPPGRPAPAAWNWTPRGVRRFLLAGAFCARACVPQLNFVVAMATRNLVSGCCSQNRVEGSISPAAHNRLWQFQLQ